MTGALISCSGRSETAMELNEDSISGVTELQRRFNSQPRKVFYAKSITVRKEGDRHIGQGHLNQGVLTILNF